MNGLPGVVGLLVVAMFAFVLAAPPASRCLRRVMRAPGGPSARPASPAAGRAAVPPREAQPTGTPTAPFAYDNGLIIEAAREET